MAGRTYIDGKKKVLMVDGSKKPEIINEDKMIPGVSYVLIPTDETKTKYEAVESYTLTVNEIKDTEVREGLKNTISENIKQLAVDKDSTAAIRLMSLSNMVVTDSIERVAKTSLEDKIETAKAKKQDLFLVDRKTTDGTPNNIIHIVKDGVEVKIPFKDVSSKMDEINEAIDNIKLQIPYNTKKISLTGTDGTTRNYSKEQYSSHFVTTNIEKENNGYYKTPMFNFRPEVKAEGKIGDTITPSIKVIEPFYDEKGMIHPDFLDQAGVQREDEWVNEVVQHSKSLDEVKMAYNNVKDRQSSSSDWEDRVFGSTFDTADFKRYDGINPKEHGLRAWFADKGGQSLDTLAKEIGKSVEDIISFIKEHPNRKGNYKDPVLESLNNKFKELKKGTKIRGSIENYKYGASSEERYNSIVAGFDKSKVTPLLGDGYESIMRNLYNHIINTAFRLNKNAASALSHAYESWTKSPITTDDRLKTFDFNSFAGTPKTKETEDEFRSNVLNNPDKSMLDNGESFNDAFKRVTEVTKELKKSAKDNTVVVTHNTVFGLIKLWEAEGSIDYLEKGDDGNLTNKEAYDEFRKKYLETGNDYVTGEHYSIESDKGSIHIVRHGETSDNAKGNYRSNKAQLTDIGVDQAHKAGIALSGFSVPEIISSPLDRAIETSNIILDQQSEAAKELNNTRSELAKRRNDPLVKSIIDNWGSIYKPLMDKLTRTGFIPSETEMDESERKSYDQNEAEFKSNKANLRLLPVLLNIKNGIEDKYCSALGIENTEEPIKILHMAQGVLVGKYCKNINEAIVSLENSGYDWAKQLAENLRNATETQKQLFLNTTSLASTNPISAYLKMIGGALKPIKMKANRFESITAVKQIFERGFQAVSTIDNGQRIVPIIKDLPKENASGEDVQFAFRQLGINLQLPLCEDETFKGLVIPLFDKIKDYYKKNGKVSISNALNDKSFDDLANLIIKYTNESMDTSFKSGGKSMASRIRPSFIDKVVSGLKSFDPENPDGLLSKLINLPESARTGIITALQNRKDIKRVEKFMLALAPFVMESDRSAGKKEMSDLNPRERLMMKMTLFLSDKPGKGEDKSANRLNFMLPSNSGARTHSVLSLPIDEGYYVDKDTHLLSDETKNTMFNHIVKPEIDRMLKAREIIKAGDKNSKEYNDAKKRLFFLSIPELNDVTYEGERVVNHNGLTFTDKHQAAMEDAIRMEFNKHVDNAIEDFKSHLEKLNFVNKVDDGYLANKSAFRGMLERKYTSRNQDLINEFSSDFVARHMVFNADIRQSIMNDLSDVVTSKDAGLMRNLAMAATKTGEKSGIADIVYKNVHTQADARLKNYQSPSDRGGESFKPTVRVMVVKDIPAENQGEIFKSTDGHGRVTLEEGLHELCRVGDVSPTLYTTVRDHIKENPDYSYKSLKAACVEAGVGKEFDNQVYTPMKQLYMGMEVVGDKRQFTNIKNSDGWLVPWHTEGTALDPLRKYMEGNDIDRMEFASAVKMSNAEIHTAFKDGEFVEPKTLNPYEISRDGLGTVLKAGNGGDEVSRVTQLQRNFLDGFYHLENFVYKEKTMTGEQLMQTHNDLVRQMYDANFNKLVAELGTYEDGSFMLSESGASHLKNMLLTESFDGNWDIQLQDFIRNNDLKSLMFSTNSDKIMQVISSVVRNQVVNYPMNGRTYVVSPASELGEIKTSEAVRPTKLATLENGVIKLGDNEVIIPNPFDENISVADIDPELLTIFVNRIPNSGPQLSAGVKVVGLVPKDNNTMHVSSNLFHQMGMDSDFDQLYTFLKNSKVVETNEGKKVVVDSSGDKKTQNDLMDCYLSAHANPDARKFIEKPLDYGGLDKTASKLKDLISGKRISYLSPLHDDKNIEDGASRKSAIATFANVSSLFSILTKTGGIEITKKNQIPVVIGGHKSGGKICLSNESVERAKDIDCVALDDEKKGNMRTLAITQDRFNALTYLTAVNMNPESRTLFLNHPAVQEYLDVRNNSSRYSALEYMERKYGQKEGKILSKTYDGSVLTDENIKSSIENKDSQNYHPNGDEYMAAVQQFDQCEKYGQEISKLNKFASLNSSGAPVEMAESALMEKEYNDIIKEGVFKGVKKAFENSVVASSVEYGLKRHNDFVENFNFSNSQDFQKILNNVTSYAKFGTKDKVVSKQISDGIKLYLLQHAFGDDVNLRKTNSFLELKKAYEDALDKEHPLNKIDPNVMASLEPVMSKDGKVIEGFHLATGTETSQTFNNMMTAEMFKLSQTEEGKAFLRSMIDYSITNGKVFDYDGMYRHIPYSVLATNDRYLNFRAATEGNNYQLKTLLGSDFEKIYNLNHSDDLTTISTDSKRGFKLIGDKDAPLSFSSRDYDLENKKYVTFVNSKEEGHLYSKEGDITEFEETKSGMIPIKKYTFVRVNDNLKENNFYSEEANIPADYTLKTASTEAKTIGLSEHEQKVGSVLDSMLKSNNTNEYYKGLINFFKDLDILKDVTIKNDSIRSRGEYRNGSIRINTDKCGSDQELHKTILHEMIHALTSWAENNNVASEHLDRLKDTFKELQNTLSEEDRKLLPDLIKKLEEYKSGETRYFSGKETALLPFADFNEFMAESVTDEGVKGLLEKMESVDKPTTFIEKIKQGFKDFFDYISSIIPGMKKSRLTDTLEDLYNVADAYKDNYSLESEPLYSNPETLSDVLEKSLDLKNYNPDGINILPKSVSLGEALSKILEINKNMPDKDLVLGHYEMNGKTVAYVSERAKMSYEERKTMLSGKDGKDNTLIDSLITYCS